ncbi:hypothetical protein KSB_61960 [Ktedonobacter robiniae]|uniref:Uncharacterized protein n=2 Tax=Ktedonobacter robiniae TaxID=2778365 RepID=A0ABQ3UYD7_9CHLR|nr:hypothetical protein KSB_61960 [Ktedonobacter robiniae]
MATLKKLLGEADILIHGYRTDALARLGLGSEMSWDRWLSDRGTDERRLRTSYCLNRAGMDDVFPLDVIRQLGVARRSEEAFEENAGEWLEYMSFSHPLQEFSQLLGLPPVNVCSFFLNRNNHRLP